MIFTKQVIPDKLALSLVISLLFAPVCSAQQKQPPADQVKSQPPADQVNSNSQQTRGSGQEALLTSPDAREVATYRCSPEDNGCPLTPEIGGTIASKFRQPLKRGDGTDTEFASAIKAVLRSSPYMEEPVWDSRKTPNAIIHIVDWGGPGATGIAQDRWFLATRRSGRNEFDLSESRRIYGKKRLSVIFIHVGAVVGSGVNPRMAYSNVSYRAIVKTKLPANIQNLLGLLRIAAQTERSGEAKSFIGFGTLTDISVPSDITIFGVRTNTMQVIGQSSVYDNEGKYFWDASVGVPVNKISLLEYSEENGTFTPKQINKQSVYAMINLYPVPVDIKGGTLSWALPRAVFGIGMTGRPGDNFMFGVAWGIPQLQFFVGSAFANHRILLPGQDPKVATSYIQRYDSRLTYGINVPVFSALKKLQSKK